MKICFLLEHFTGGGIGRAVSVLGNALNREEGFQTCALGLSQNGKEDIFFTDFPVSYLYEQCHSLTKAVLFHNYIGKAAQYLSANQVDVVIGCGAFLYPIAVLAGRLARCRVICWEHTNPLQTGSIRFLKESRWFGAVLSDANVVLTKSALEIYRRKYPGKNHVQIYNPIEETLEAVKPTYRAECKRIISVGKLDYPKNFQRLIQIAADVLPHHPDWQWDIYGEGPDREELVQMISRLGLSGQLHLMGQSRALYARYPEYAFLVMTSRYEGFPMTLLEAAANGLPMVAFDVLTGPGEIIEDGRNGFLCPPEENRTMVDRLEELISSEALRREMSAASRKTAENFALGKILPQWIELLRGLPDL